MNYALDALWWQLTHPVVRDLAALLTAPPLWQHPCPLPVRELLGTQGFRYLLDLNDTPQKLPENPGAARLGHYAENLLAFWLDSAPHSRLIAHNLPVRQNTQTLGALDFIAELSGCLYHIELTAKYYGAADGAPGHMSGLNSSDTLSAKRRLLTRQLDLSQHPVAANVLAAHGIRAAGLHRAALIRGTAFSANGSLPPHSVYPPNVWTGLLLTQPEDWQQLDAAARFYQMPRTAYLAPARVSEAHTLSRREAENGSSGLYALLEKRSDGFWHEIRRIMYRKAA